MASAAARSSSTTASYVDVARRSDSTLRLCASQIAFDSRPTPPGTIVERGQFRYREGPRSPTPFYCRPRHTEQLNEVLDEQHVWSWGRKRFLRLIHCSPHR